MEKNNKTAFIIFRVVSEEKELAIAKAGGLNKLSKLMRELLTKYLHAKDTP